jgi:hypothetical protein
MRLTSVTVTVIVAPGRSCSAQRAAITGSSTALATGRSWPLTVDRAGYGRHGPA